MEQIISAYCKACQFRSSRARPLVYKNGIIFRLGAEAQQLEKLNEAQTYFQQMLDQENTSDYVQEAIITRLLRNTKLPALKKPK
jgi:hypothetical protein